MRTKEPAASTIKKFVKIRQGIDVEEKIRLTWLLSVSWPVALTRVMMEEVYLSKRAHEERARENAVQIRRKKAEIRELENKLKKEEKERQQKEEVNKKKALQSDGQRKVIQQKVQKVGQKRAIQQKTEEQKEGGGSRRGLYSGSSGAAL